MKHCVRGFAAVVFVVSISGAAPAFAASSPPETTTLKNGMRVVLAPDADAQAVDVAVWYGTGPVVEPPGQSGITHLFERLMYRATEGRAAGEYRRLLQAEGAVVSTWTTPDFTSYYATVPEPALDLALELEAERMAKLKITAADLDADRALVLRERQGLLETNPVALGVEKLYATAFPGHGYGRSVLGADKELRSLSRDDALHYYRDRFGPNNAMITIVGRFDPSEAMTAVRKDFESLPRRGQAVEPAALPRPSARGRASVSGRVPIVLAGWRAPASKDPETAPLEILARVLGSGVQGRLSRDLPASSAILLARAGFDRAEEGSFFYTFATIKSMADSAAAESALVGAVEALADEPVSAEELDRAKRDWELEWLSDQQTVRGRARSIGTALLVDGDTAAPARRREVIRNLTPADLQAAAQKVLQPETRSVMWLTPVVSAERPRPSGRDVR